MSLYGIWLKKIDKYRRTGLTNLTKTFHFVYIVKICLNNPYELGDIRIN